MFPIIAFAKRSIPNGRTIDNSEAGATLEFLWEGGHMPLFDLENGRRIIKVPGPVVVQEGLGANRVTNIFLPERVPTNTVSTLTESANHIVRVRRRRTEPRSYLRVDFEEKDAVFIDRNRDVVIHGMGDSR